LRALPVNGGDEVAVGVVGVGGRVAQRIGDARDVARRVVGVARDRAVLIRLGRRPAA